MKNVKSLLVFGIVLFLPLFLIDSVYATAFDKAQTSKSGIVDMFEVLPEYLQVNSTAENRDFHIKRNERSIGTGTQYYFYFEGGSVTVSLTTNGLLSLGGVSIGTSTINFNNVLFNTFLGYQVGSNTTGNSNSGTGYQSLYSLTTGNSNDAHGYQSLYFDVDGGGNNGYGYRSLYTNISGSNNVAFGFTALFANTASNNTAIGYAAGDGISSGGSNTVIGYNAGRNITTGNNNIVIGASVNAGSSTANNQLNIGNAITGDVVTGQVNIPGRLTSNSPILFFYSNATGTGTSYGGTTTARNLYSYIMPANTMGSTSALRIWTGVSNGSITAGAVTWTWNVYDSITLATTTTRTLRPTTISLTNEDTYVFRGSTTACIVFNSVAGGLGGTSTPFVPLVVNVTATNTISLLCSHTSGTPTIVGTSTLEYCYGEILK